MQWNPNNAFYVQWLLQKSVSKKKYEDFINSWLCLSESMFLFWTYITDLKSFELMCHF